MCIYEEFGGNSVAISCCGDPRFCGKQPVQLAADEALELISGERVKHYGDPRSNLADIAATWTPYVKRALAVHDELTATDVCALMALLKIVRQARGFHRGSTVDVIGYVQLAEVVNDDAAYSELLRTDGEETN